MARKALTSITPGRLAGAPAAGPSPLADQLCALEQAPLPELRARWRQLIGAEPPRLSRDLLLRALAYHVQERRFGGLSRASLRLLGAGERGGGPAAPDVTPAPTLQPGTRLVREWHGHTHVVSVTAAGFDYAGATHRSLTAIARQITGARWSGPRFFGLTAGHKVEGERTHA